MAFDPQEGQGLTDLAYNQLPSEAAGCLEQGAVQWGLPTAKQVTYGLNWASVVAGSSDSEGDSSSKRIRLECR